MGGYKELGKLIVAGYWTAGSNARGSGPVRSSHLILQQGEVENPLEQESALSNGGINPCLPYDSHEQLFRGSVQNANRQRQLLQS